MSYIDDLLGEDFEKKRIELERKLKRYSPDYNIIADAISKEILVHLERRLKGLEFPRITENSKQDQSTYEANCIFKNCERRIFEALKKVNKNTNIETNEIAQNTSSELNNGDLSRGAFISGLLNIEFDKDYLLTENSPFYFLLDDNGYNRILSKKTKEAVY